MMQALTSFAQAVYDEDHLDREMKILITQLNSFEWKDKYLGKLHWMSKVEYKTVVNLQLDIFITDEDGNELDRDTDFPTWSSYQMKVEFTNLNKFNDSPLCKAFYGLFKHSYPLDNKGDIEEGKKVLVDMVKFFTLGLNPFPECECDEKCGDVVLPLEFVS